MELRNKMIDKESDMYNEMIIKLKETSRTSQGWMTT